MKTLKALLGALLKTAALITLWVLLLLPCHRLCAYAATEYYPNGAAPHRWFQVAVRDGADRTALHPSRLPPQADILRTPFDTGMGFYLQQVQNGLYETGSEIGFGMARSRYRTDGHTVEPVSFVYEGMHNVILPAALASAVLVWLLFQLMRRHTRKRIQSA